MAEIETIFSPFSDIRILPETELYKLPPIMPIVLGRTALQHIPFERRPQTEIDAEAGKTHA